MILYDYVVVKMQSKAVVQHPRLEIKLVRDRSILTNNDAVRERSMIRLKVGHCVCFAWGDQLVVASSSPFLKLGRF